MNWSEWTLPIRHLPVPDSGVVDVWLCQLPRSEEDASALRFRQQFVLRLLLAAYLDTPGKDIAIRRDQHGKPELVNQPLQFNVAHSGHWWALAVSSNGAVGIDVETDRSVRDPLALARRFFHPSAAAHLEAIKQASMRQSRFLQLWTAHEAVVKAMGLGLARGLSGLLFDPNKEPLSLHQVPAGWPAAEQWTLHQMQEPSPLTISVAAPQPKLTLSLRRLDASALSAAIATPQQPRPAG